MRSADKWVLGLFFSLICSGFLFSYSNSRDITLNAKQSRKDFNAVDRQVKDINTSIQIKFNGYAKREELKELSPCGDDKADKNELEQLIRDFNRNAIKHTKLIERIAAKLKVSTE